MEVSTPSGNLSVDAYANAKKAVTLSITNTGNVDLTNLNLTSSAASNWDVSFDESTIDLLEAGATKEVTAYQTALTQLPVIM
ncbi:MAG: NEW3 domain-containing protein [Lachnospiraceae bacterium]